MDQTNQSEWASTSSSPTAGFPPIPPVPSPLSGPVTDPERIESIDVLRGVAVLGILLLNIQAFAMISAAYMNPTATGELTGINYWVWYFSHLLGDQKFMSIFSMLFGAGVVLMTSRSEQRTGRSAAVHYKRMGWLILFGFLHAHLFWYGDILYSYGMCGLVVYLFRRMRPMTLIILGMIALVVPNLVNLGFYGLYQILPAEAQEQWYEQQLVSWAPTPEQAQQEIDAYRGGWLDQVPPRSFMAAMFQTFMLAAWIGWRAGGLMLIGMALYKSNVFSAARSYGFYITMAVVGLFVGLVLTMGQIALNEANNWPAMQSMYTYYIVHYWGSFAQSLGYIALVMLFCKSGVLGLLQSALAAVGRMALTNYLMQTIICTTIFYGHGFGYYGHLDRVEQLGVVAAVWIVELIWSPIWLKYFRFGPFEWLWRTLTYWKLQPLRRTRAAQSVSE